MRPGLVDHFLDLAADGVEGGGIAEMLAQKPDILSATAGSSGVVALLSR